MKQCCTCKLPKQFSEFNNRASNKDGKQDRCRDCCKEWYKRYAVEHRKRVKVRGDRIWLENSYRINEYLKTHPCVDCGEDDFVVLDFDHLRDKRKSISLMKKYSWETIQKEIDKCEVVCSNCHRRRTAKRGKYYQYLDV